MLKQLEIELSKTTQDFRHTKLYKILKTKLTELGYWRNRPRGNPAAGFKKMKEISKQLRRRS